MNPYILRIVSLILIPCLIDSPLAASGMISLSSTNVAVAAVPFHEQAIVPSSFVSHATAPRATSHLFKWTTFEYHCASLQVAIFHGLKLRPWAFVLWGIALTAVTGILVRALIGYRRDERERAELELGKQRVKDLKAGLEYHVIKAQVVIHRALLNDPLFLAIQTALNAKMQPLLDFFTHGDEGFKDEDLLKDNNIPLYKILKLVAKMKDPSPKFAVTSGADQIRIIFGPEKDRMVTIKQTDKGDTWVVLPQSSETVMEFREIKIAQLLSILEKADAHKDYVMHTPRNRDQRPAQHRSFVLLAGFLLISTIKSLAFSGSTIESGDGTSLGVFITSVTGIVSVGVGIILGWLAVLVLLSRLSFARTKTYSAKSYTEQSA